MTPGFQATTTEGITVTVRSVLPRRPIQTRGRAFCLGIIMSASPITARQIAVQLLPPQLDTSPMRMVVCPGMLHSEGVVGETPRLEPGEVFEYTSGTPLAIFGYDGVMAVPRYHMLAMLTGTEFDIDIPTFSLDSPHQNTLRCIEPREKLPARPDFERRASACQVRKRCPYLLSRASQRPGLGFINAFRLRRPALNIHIPPAAKLIGGHEKPSRRRGRRRCAHACCALGRRRPRT